MVVENQYPRRKWTVDEDAVICQHYATRGAQICVAQMVDRTVNQVCSRAKAMGIRRDGKRTDMFDGHRTQLQQIAETAYELFGGEFAGAVTREGSTAKVVCNMLRELAAYRNAAGTSE